MKLTKTLLSACLLVASMFSSLVWANVQAVQTTVVPKQQPEIKRTVKKVEIITDKLNINKASAIEIQRALTGIGSKKAKTIVEYREKHGPFTALEQLMEVQGIGRATLERNKNRIVL